MYKCLWILWNSKNTKGCTDTKIPVSQYTIFMLYPITHKNKNQKHQKSVKKSEIRHHNINGQSENGLFKQKATAIIHNIQ